MSVGFNRHSPTSRAGADDVAPRASSQRQVLLEEYRLAGEHGLTNYEAGAAADLLDTCYWKRCGELLDRGAIGPLLDITGEPMTRMNPESGSQQAVNVYLGDEGDSTRSPRRRVQAKALMDLVVHDCTCGDHPQGVIDVRDLLALLKDDA